MYLHYGLGIGKLKRYTEHHSYYLSMKSSFNINLHFLRPTGGQNMKYIIWPCTKHTINNFTENKLSSSTCMQITWSPILLLFSGILILRVQSYFHLHFAFVGLLTSHQKQSILHFFLPKKMGTISISDSLLSCQRFKKIT